MSIPTWMTLKKLPIQFACVATIIAGNLNKVFATEMSNNLFVESRFYVILNTNYS